MGLTETRDVRRSSLRRRRGGPGPTPRSLDPPPGMGNTGPGGLTGAQECPSSAAPRPRPSRGPPPSALLPGGQATATEGGGTRVVPEGAPEARAKPGPVPPLRMALSAQKHRRKSADHRLCAQEAPGVPERARHSGWGRGQSAAARQLPGHTLGRLHAEAKPNKEVAPAASRPTGGGAAQIWCHQEPVWLQTPARTPRVPGRAAQLQHQVC